MAFKQKGFNPGVGTGMGGAFSPNRIVKVSTVNHSGKKSKDGKVGKGKFTPPVKVENNPTVFEKKSVNKRLSPNKKESKFSMNREEAIAAHKAMMKKTIEKMKADGAKPEEITKYVNQERTKLKEGGSDYLKHSVGVEGPGTYVKEGGEVKTSMKKLPIGSEERKAEYDRRGWKYDDTIAGYNKDGTKKEETPTNQPESDPTPDPTEPKQDDITEPEYKVSSQTGRKTTTATRQGNNVTTYQHTDRNIGDKEVFTGTGHEKGDIRHKKKYDKKGKQTKDKKKYTLPDGTVVKVKDKKKGKKVKVRKKGQLFARKVDPSELENMNLPTHDKNLDKYK